jgi:pimeloyl-ACP methyl ester carboxylesterase
VANNMVTLRSGRSLGLSATGDPIARRLVLFCHPTPGAGLFDPDPVITSKWGVHVVMLDRPGYGPTPLEGDEGADARGRGGEPPTIQHRADDLAEYLQSAADAARGAGGVAFGSVGVVGWGTGGMVALSLAGRHPELVDRVATVNTAAPHGLTFDPAVQALAPFSRESLFILPDDPALERPGLGNRIDRMLIEAGRHGSDGVESDRRMLADHGWTRDLGRIRAHVKLIHGDDDPNSDIEDGRWYRRRIRRADTVRVPDEGALAIATRWRRILNHVAPEHGTTA